MHIRSDTHALRGLYCLVVGIVRRVTDGTDGGGGERPEGAAHPALPAASAQHRQHLAPHPPVPGVPPAHGAAALHPLPGGSSLGPAPQGDVRDSPQPRDPQRYDRTRRALLLARPRPGDVRRQAM